MLDNLPALMSVFAVAFLSLWASIPTGYALSLSTLVIIVTASISYALGVAIVALPGERVKNWLLAKMGRKSVISDDSLIYRAWKRFGLIGLALLAPITTGAQLGAAIGLTLNAPPRRLLVWMTIGAFLWSALIAAAISLGLVAVQG